MFYLQIELVLAVAVVLVSVVALRLSYNLFFHPLRSYPGPWYAAISIAWFVYHTAKGDHYHAVHQLHLKYGPIVRTAPDELSFIDAQAWKDIYGYRPGSPEYPKEPSQFFADDPAHPNILIAPHEQHSRLRKLLASAFSDKALREQEPVLNSYAMALVEALRAKRSEPVDMVKWYNFTTFDVIGHLAFAEPFNCLSNSDYHPWIEMIINSARFLTWTRVLGRLAPGFVPFLLGLIPKRISQDYNANWQMTKEKLMRRRERQLDYVDFLTHLLKAEEQGVIDTADVVSNSPLLVIAGSETTATLLAGATYYILKNPRVYDRLVAEIRSSFESHGEMTLARISNLKYLLAVLDEALRLYPPLNSSHPRVLPAQGGTICGQHIPGGTLVGVPQYACFRSARNFADPDQFVPERALDEDERYAGDRREALQPFHVGPRSCIGRNLAYMEARLIMTHLLFEFDLELAPGMESVQWEIQEVYATWLKKPMLVQLRPVARG